LFRTSKRHNRKLVRLELRNRKLVLLELRNRRKVLELGRMLELVRSKS